MKITSRRSVPSWMWKYWKQVWCLGTREMKGKGWEVSRSEDGGLRRPLLEEGRWPGSHMPWMLDGEEKKKKQATEIKGPLRTKEIHKIRRHTHASLSPPKAPFIKETTLLCTEKTHANREARRPAQRHSYCWSQPRKRETFRGKQKKAGTREISRC